MLTFYGLFLTLIFCKFFVSFFFLLIGYSFSSISSTLSQYLRPAFYFYIEKAVVPLATWPGVLVKWQVLGLRIARSRFQVWPGSCSGRHPSTLKRRKMSTSHLAESEIHCLDNCEVPCYGHPRWHSGALLGSSHPGSAWLPDKGSSSYLLAYHFRFSGSWMTVSNWTLIYRIYISMDLRIYRIVATCRIDR